MKRKYSVFLTFALIACCFLAGCGNGEKEVASQPQEQPTATDTPAEEVNYQLPTVGNMDQETLTKQTREIIETIYGIDLSGREVKSTLDQDDISAEYETISFMDANGEAPYLADVDSESKQVVAIETVAPKSDIPSDAAKQTEYIAAAKAFAEEYLKATGLQEAVCYQPVQPTSGEVTTNSVYVVFPEMQTYVEVSADEGHALVGYRHFADEQALGQFLERQGKAF